MTGSHHIPLRRDLYFDINILPLIWVKFQNLTTKTGESKCLVRDLTIVTLSTNHGLHLFNIIYIDYDSSQIQNTSCDL